MNISSNIQSGQAASPGILFTADGEGRFLMTQAMLGQLPFAGISGNQLMRLHDLLCMEAGPVISSLLRETLTGSEEGLTRRVVVRDREGRLLNMGLSRMAGCRRSNSVSGRRLPAGDRSGRRRDSHR